MEGSSPGSFQHVPHTDPVPAQAGQQQQPQQTVEQRLTEQLHRKDAQIDVLQRKLEHFRSWLSSLQGQLQHKDPQVLKNARRLYIGGIPEGTREAELRSFFDGVMTSTGAACGPGSSILTCKISSDKSYAFLEMRSVEEASNAMAFDGVVYRDTNLKIRRPSNYSTADAISLGPMTPDPTIDTTGLPMCKTVVEDSWNKIFIGGLPCHFTDEQVKDLLQPYGALKSFNLVMDKTTGKSKGYAFCEFADPRVINAVINGLHMQCLERKVLTVKRALEGTRQGGGARYATAPLGSQPPLSPAAPTPDSSSSRAVRPLLPHGDAAATASAAARRGSGGYTGEGYQQQQQGTGRGSGRGPASAESPHPGSRQPPPQQQQQHAGPGGGGELLGPSAAVPAAPGPHHGGGFGFYIPPDHTATMFGPGMLPAGPMHGWPSHSGYPGGSSGSSQGSGSLHHRLPQQQLGFGSSWGPGIHQRGPGSHMPSSRGAAAGPERFGTSPKSSQHAPEGPSSTGASGAAAVAAAAAAAASPGTPSPVPPSPGSSQQRSQALSPGIGGGAATAAAALAGARRLSGSGSSALATTVEDVAPAGSSSLYHQRRNGSSGRQQKPSEGSNSGGVAAAGVGKPR